MEFFFNYSNALSGAVDNRCYNCGPSNDLANPISTPYPDELKFITQKFQIWVFHYLALKCENKKPMQLYFPLMYGITAFHSKTSIRQLHNNYNWEDSAESLIAYSNFRIAVGMEFKIYDKWRIRLEPLGLRGPVFQIGVVYAKP